MGKHNVERVGSILVGMPYIMDDRPDDMVRHWED
jgi:hypothetical protein